MRKTLLSTLVIAALASCTSVALYDEPKGGNGNDSGGGDQNPWGEGEILLSTPNVLSRKPFEGNVGAGNPLQARVIAAYSPGYFKGDNSIHVDGVMKFENNGKETGFSSVNSGNKFYPSEDRTLFLFGLYPTERGCNVCPPEDGTEAPVDAWELDRTGSAYQFVITGCEDVMIAPIVETSRTQSAAKLPNLTFKHALTRLNVSLGAKYEDGLDLWGSVKSITLLGVGKGKDSYEPVDSRVILFPEDSEFARMRTDVPATGGFSFFKASGELGGDVTYTDDVYEKQNDKITLTPTLRAYTMMVPLNIVDGDKLILQIDLNKGGQMTPEPVAVTLKNKKGGQNFVGSTRGKSFDINLTFDAKEITATADVEDWEEGGDSETPVE